MEEIGDVAFDPGARNFVITLADRASFGPGRVAGTSVRADLILTVAPLVFILHRVNPGRSGSFADGLDCLQHTGFFKLDAPWFQDADRH